MTFAKKKSWSDRRPNGRHTIFGRQQRLVSRSARLTLSRSQLLLHAHRYRMASKQQMIAQEPADIRRKSTKWSLEVAEVVKGQTTGRPETCNLLSLGSDLLASILAFIYPYSPESLCLQLVGSRQLNQVLRRLGHSFKLGIDLLGTNTLSRLDKIGALPHYNLSKVWSSSDMDRRTKLLPKILVHCIKTDDMEGMSLLLRRCVAGKIEWFDISQQTAASVWEALMTACFVPQIWQIWHEHFELDADHKSPIVLRYATKYGRLDVIEKYCAANELIPTVVLDDACRYGNMVVFDWVLSRNDTLQPGFAKDIEYAMENCFVASLEDKTFAMSCHLYKKYFVEAGFPQRYLNRIPWLFGTWFVSGHVAALRYMAQTTDHGLLHFQDFMFWDAVSAGSSELFSFCIELRGPQQSFENIAPLAEHILLKASSFANTDVIVQYILSGFSIDIATLKRAFIEVAYHHKAGSKSWLMLLERILSEDEMFGLSIVCICRTYRPTDDQYMDLQPLLLAKISQCHPRDASGRLWVTSDSSMAFLTIQLASTNAVWATETLRWMWHEGLVNKATIQSCLPEACLVGHVDTVAFMLEMGGQDLHQKSMALGMAVRSGNLEMVDTLILYGASMQSLPSCNPMLIAIEGNNLSMLKLLIDRCIGPVNVDHLLEAAITASARHPAIIMYLVARFTTHFVLISCDVAMKLLTIALQQKKIFAITTLVDVLLLNPSWQKIRLAFWRVLLSPDVDQETVSLIKSTYAQSSMSV